MSGHASPLRRTGVLALCALLAAVAGAFTRQSASSAAPPRSTLAYDPGVAPADRAAIAAALARARPEARALVAQVAGLVTVRVAGTGGTSVGLTAGRRGEWTVTVDLRAVEPRYGQRGVDRVVLHEFGHVLDFQRLPADLRGRLDAGIPRGWGCDDGTSGACATQAERFAETFAKWASGDLGVDLHLGYKVPPPEAGLEAWGTPLAALGRAG